MCEIYPVNQHLLLLEGTVQRERKAEKLFQGIWKDVGAIWQSFYEPDHDPLHEGDWSFSYSDQTTIFILDIKNQDGTLLP